jgi:hypothetical protein
LLIVIVLPQFAFQMRSKTHEVANFFPPELPISSRQNCKFAVTKQLKIEAQLSDHLRSANDSI